ncbi:CHAT domain-containing protein, partial [Amylibacter sp.]|nr:CHAT domain-containing protein [Amylibacter sp.]
LLINLDSLIIIPSGPLESIPFNLLITEKPRTYKNDFKSYQNAAWFLKTHNLTRLPSIKSLKSLRSEKTLKNTNNIFIGFGNPSLRKQDNTVRVISLNDIFRGKNTDIETLRGLPELPQTFIELNQIAEYLDTSKDDLYLKDRATETNVKSIDLSKASIISFATHGLIAGDLNELEEPALVLTPPKTASEFDDGLLTASEIMLLKLNANWVLLSACNTAAGETLNAEGLSGLARAFIYAGTQSLLVSHWKIESNAATKITTGIFDIIQEYPNIKNSEALRRSLLRLLKNNENPHYAHPAFWAPFSLVGDGLSI